LEWRKRIAHFFFVIRSEWITKLIRLLERLEGSRFGAHPVALATFASSLVRPKRVKTGGSRERLNVWFVSWYLK
jgi:hypothetical protein